MSSYPSFKDIKEVTEVDLDELYPPEDYSEEELLEIFKNFMEGQHEMDNTIFAFHQILFYCIDHGFSRLGKLFYLAMEEKTNTFLYYAIEREKLYMLTFFLENKLFDDENMNKDLIDRISNLYSSKMA